MRYIKSHVVRAVALSVATLFFSCKQSTDVSSPVINISDPSSEAITLTSQAWAAFENKDYLHAEDLFSQAIQSNDLYADAYNGLGWTFGRLDSMRKALQYFDVSLGLSPGFIDAYAGRSLVSLALGKYQDAITAVTIVQEFSSGFYAFRHDPKISMNDLLLVKAQSYFMLNDYPSAQVLINQLDPHNQLDPLKPSYVEDLALEIENLWKQI